MLIVLSGVVLAITGDEGLDAVLGLQAALEVSLLAVAFGFAAARGVGGSPWSALGFRAPQPDSWRWAVVAFFAYLFVAVAYSLLITAPEQRDLADELGFNTGLAGAVSAAIAIVIIAPIAEETFFRGFFYGSIRDLTSPWPAALISGALFGVIHLSSGEFSTVPPLFAFGVILAWLYQRTGSIWPPIAVHMVNNALAFTLLVAPESVL